MDGNSPRSGATATTTNHHTSFSSQQPLEQYATIGTGVAGARSSNNNQSTALVEQLRMALGLGNPATNQEQRNQDLLNELICSLLVRNNPTMATTSSLHDTTARTSFGPPPVGAASHGIDLATTLLLIAQEQQRRRQEQEQRDQQITQLLAALTAGVAASNQTSASGGFLYPHQQQTSLAGNHPLVVGDTSRLLDLLFRENGPQNSLLSSVLGANYPPAPSPAPAGGGGVLPSSDASKSLNTLLVSALLGQNVSSASDGINSATMSRQPPITSMSNQHPNVVGQPVMDGSRNGRSVVDTRFCENGNTGIEFRQRHFVNPNGDSHSTEDPSSHVHGNLLHIISAYNALNGNSGISAGGSTNTSGPNNNLSNSTSTAYAARSDLLNLSGNHVSRDKGMISRNHLDERYGLSQPGKMLSRTSIDNVDSYNQFQPSNCNQEGRAFSSKGTNNDGTQTQTLKACGSNMRTASSSSSCSTSTNGEPDSTSENEDLCNSGSGSSSTDNNNFKGRDTMREV